MLPTRAHSPFRHKMPPVPHHILHFGFSVLREKIRLNGCFRISFSSKPSSIHTTCSVYLFILQTLKKVLMIIQISRRISFLFDSRIKMWANNSSSSGRGTRSNGFIIAEMLKIKVLDVCFVMLVFGFLSNNLRKIFGSFLPSLNLNPSP